MDVPEPRPQMHFKEYSNHSGALDLTPTLRALLTETGEHVFRLAFEKEPEVTRNFLFAVLVTRSKLLENRVGEICAWEDMKPSPSVLVCYELCDAFPLCEDSPEFVRLQLTMQRILGMNVWLLPSTLFQRSIGYYPELMRVFAEGEFNGVFRHDPGSILDMRMHAVLDRALKGPFACPSGPIANCAAPVTGIPQDEWNTFFKSLANVFWYHTYVYEVLGESTANGFGLNTVMRTQEALSTTQCSNLHGKLALLDVLRLVYRYNYNSA
jgi:hypothetical protein